MPINLILRLVMQLIMQLGPEWAKRLPWDQILKLIEQLIGRIRQLEQAQAQGQEVQEIDWNELISLVIRIIQLIMDSRPPMVATMAYPNSPQKEGNELEANLNTLRDMANQYNQSGENVDDLARRFYKDNQ